MNEDRYARYPSLADRSVFVTGGASGIGASLVAHLVQAGARVAYVDLDEAAAAGLNQALTQAGLPEPWFRRIDITQTNALQEAILSAAGAHGPIRVLINNAASDDRHDVEDLTLAYWQDRLAVNLTPHVFAAQAVAPGMKAAGGGSIINMGSITWMIGQADMPGYSAAKAAITGLTRALARRWGPDGIRVNCLMPGAVLTDRQRRLWLTPAYEAEVLSRQCLKRHLLPEEVARLALFLAADDSSAMTGQNYIIDGGWV